MECNREDARKAIQIAETKLSQNDHSGAKRFASKAKTLYPTLDGLEQISAMIDVYVSASNKTNGSESDWYGILGVDPLAEEETLKKQYKKLALLLHPDKNRFNGAEGAFKLVLHAWSLLSDKDKRVAYDHKRKRKEKKSEPKPPPRAERSFKKKEKRERQEPPAGKEKEAKKKKVSSTFWTMCTHCSTYSEHVRAYYLDRNSFCPFCRGVFVATEKFPEMLNGKPFIRFAPPPPPPKPKPQGTSGSSTSDARSSMPRTPCSRFEDLNSTHEAHRLFSRSGWTGVR